VVEGVGLVAQAHGAGWRIDTLFVADGVDVEDLGLPPGCVEATGRVARLGPGVIERVATTEAPQPVIAIVERRVADPAVLDGASLVLVGDRIADPGNAGTMLRSAEAAGVDAVVFTTGSVDVFNPKVVRASAGALFVEPVMVDVGLGDAVARLRAGGLRVLGTSSHAGEPYDHADLAEPVAIVVGNEAHGLHPDIDLDGWITVPHHGRAESLNVAMAATVLVFDAARQRARR
jgi:TrmH family RNA methyltransferase